MWGCAFHSVSKTFSFLWCTKGVGSQGWSSTTLLQVSNMISFSFIAYHQGSSYPVAFKAAQWRRRAGKARRLPGMRKSQRRLSSFARRDRGAHLGMDVYTNLSVSKGVCVHEHSVCAAYRHKNTGGFNRIIMAYLLLDLSSQCHPRPVWWKLIMFKPLKHEQYSRFSKINFFPLVTHAGIFFEWGADNQKF